MDPVVFVCFDQCYFLFDIGGYSTAGLGGIGGPFRLDAGNDVAQMPDSVKEQVPEHIRQKARQVAREEYQKRLREIDMSEHDADAYNQLYTKIAKQSAQLKVVIENLQVSGCTYVHYVFYNHFT
jgi:hypothetical protein